MNEQRPDIRLATLDDTDALVELASTTFRDTYHLLDDPDDIADYVATNFTRDILAATIADATSTLYVTSVVNRLIGYLQLKRSEAPPCVTGPAPIELARLYLRAEALGKGYGNALMRTAHAEARRQGCETIWLGVYDLNTRARDFYRRWGFVDVGTKDFLFAGNLYPDPVMSAPVRHDA